MAIDTLMACVGVYDGIADAESDYHKTVFACLVRRALPDHTCGSTGLDAGVTALVPAALWFQVAAGALVNQPIRGALRARLWRCLSGESPSC